MVVLGIVLSNILTLHRTRRHNLPNIWPNVSILIPARNEEKNIANCIQSLLALDYPNLEILVLDDQSTDGTPAILQQLAQLSSRINFLSGTSLPEGWLGKNWACAQLAKAARGDLFLFTDADTIYQPQALRTIISILIGEKADLLTGYPRQEMKNWGERLLVPFFSWATLCIYPLELAYRLPWPSMTHAVGQMMSFRRTAYLAVGGHAGVKDNIVDDLWLARKIKASGLRWRVTRVTDLISCRIYAGGRAAFNGFSKNLFAVFNFRLIPFFLAYLWLDILFWEPLVVFAVWLFNMVPDANGVELISCIALSLLLWIIPFSELGIPLKLAFIYPLIMLAIGLAAFQSARLTMTRRLSWKDRHFSTPRWKWL